MGKIMSNVIPDAVKSAQLVTQIQSAFNLRDQGTDRTGILYLFEAMEEPVGDILERNLKSDMFRTPEKPNQNHSTHLDKRKIMSDSNYMNDDCWISIIQLQMGFNNYLMSMQNDLTECFPFTGQTEGDELNAAFQQIYAIIKKRRERKAPCFP